MEKKNQENKVIAYLKKLGWVGFFFFLAKGLVWLAIFAGVGKCATG